MLFGLIESKIEKELRLLKLDLKNEIGYRKAKEKGLPFFSSRYSDDDRK